MQLTIENIREKVIEHSEPKLTRTAEAIEAQIQKAAEIATKRFLQPLDIEINSCSITKDGELSVEYWKVLFPDDRRTRLEMIYTSPDRPEISILIFNQYLDQKMTGKASPFSASRIKLPDKTNKVLGEAYSFMQNHIKKALAKLD